MAEKRKNTSKVPNLRFPEFNGDWSKIDLGDVALKVNSGKTPLGGEATYANEGVLFIRSQNINNNKLELQNRTYITEEINRGMKNSVVQANDILLNITGASLGRSCVVPDNFTTGNVNQHVCIIRLNKDNNPRFVQPILASQKGQNIFISLQTGSGREGLNFENIKKIPIYFPSLKEQNKIAIFLSAIDERISTQNKIIRQLESLIKSLKDRLFKQKIKFKDKNGLNFPEWKTRKLRDIATKKASNIAANSLISNEGKYKIYGATGVLKKIDFYIEEDEYVCIVKDGAGVGRLMLCEARTSVLGTLDIIKNTELSNLNFLYYLLGAIDFTKYVTGSTIPHIYFRDYSNEIIGLPCFEEQIKISKLLSSIDKKIELEKEALNHFEKQKKYLMTNIFT